MSPPKRGAEETDELRASLVGHAIQLIARDGAAALTMRALATEANCAVGLPYTVFADRAELVAAIFHAEMARLQSGLEELVARAGTATVGANLVWFAELLLDSPAVALAGEILADRAIAQAITSTVGETGHGPGTFEAAVARYLEAEKRAGRVAPDVDEEAFGFMIAGAIHNLIVSNEMYPRPTRDQLERGLAAIAARLWSPTP